MTFSLKKEIYNKIVPMAQSRLDQDDSSVAHWASGILRLRALQGNNNETVFRKKCEGAIEEQDKVQFLAIFEDLKKRFHLVELTEATQTDWSETRKRVVYLHDTFSATFVTDNMFISVNLFKKSAQIAAEAFDEEKVKEIISLFAPILKKKSERKGRACTLLRSDTIYVSDLGPAGAPLVEGNYAPSVVEDFKFLLKDLTSPSPRGRLVILNGKPGGGKTFFVRGLINDIEGSIFLIVPSSLVGHLSDPSFMPAIISLHEEERVPIILILEDADTSLLPRGADNMSTISDMLNFADGIVGSIIDLRIIATTNAKKVEIESALLRKGRLSRNVLIEAIQPLQLKEIFCRIIGEQCNEEKMPKELNAPMMLCDVYDLAATYKEKNKTEK